MASDNTTLNTGTGGDAIRDLARQAGSVKTQVVQLDLGGATANAEVLITAGQQTMAASVPVVVASNQTAIPVTDSGLTDGNLIAQIRGLALALQTPTALTTTGSATFTSLDTAGNMQVTVHGTYGFTTTPPTYVWEGSDDTGTTWYSITAVRQDTNFPESGGTLAANMSRTWNIMIGGINQVRLRISAWGTPTGSIIARGEPGGLLFQPPTASVPVSKQIITFVADGVAPSTSNTLVTLTPYVDGVAGSTGTSFTPAAGKKWRICNFTVNWRNPTAAIASVTAFLRQVSSGSVTATSPLIAAGTGYGQVATIGIGSGQWIAFGEGGIQLDPGQAIGVSAIGSLASAGMYVTVSGYQY